VENIALQSSQILYTFVLRVEIATTFGTKMVADMICQKVIYELLMSILNIYIIYIIIIYSNIFLANE
jgi:hypothetical protein